MSESRTSRTDTIAFFDLRRQLEAIRPAIRQAMDDVLDDGGYTNGPAVAAFEQGFAAFCRVPHAVAVNNGTSALHLALRCLEVGPGDEVATVSMSFIATAWPIFYAGATPVFVDIDPERMTMDPAALARAITPRTKAIIVVHLYGQVADMDPILEVARSHGIPVIEDCAQAHGAEYKGKRAGSMGALGCFSFYPSKNLGAYGEGGAVVTNHEAFAERCRVLRNQGQQEKYRHTEIGYNYRMNSFEGAILSVKLAHLESWTQRRNALAAEYGRALQGAAITTPKPPAEGRSAWHLYVIRHEQRDALRAELLEAGVETAVHYPTPIHLQPVCEQYGLKPGSLPVTESVARTCISLPLYPEMPDDVVERVAEALKSAKTPAER